MKITWEIVVGNSLLSQYLKAKYVSNKGDGVRKLKARLFGQK